jgi:hypothetical protein
MAEADLTVITNDRIDIRGSMRTPYTEDIIFEVNHDGTTSTVIFCWSIPVSK